VQAVKIAATPVQAKEEAIVVTAIQRAISWFDGAIR